MKLSKKSEKVQRTLLKQIAVGTGVAALLAGGVTALVWVDSKSSNPRTIYGKFLREINRNEENHSVEKIPFGGGVRVTGVWKWDMDDVMGKDFKSK